VTKSRTFREVDGWIRAYREVAGEAQPVLLVANKIDVDGRSVPEQEARDFAVSRNCGYLEVSAKDAVGIGAIVEELRAMVGVAKGVGQALDALDAQHGKCCS
jgi:predicted GTPase